MIHVLMVVDSLANGGVERVVRNIVLGLDTHRFQVTIYSLHAGEDYYRDELEQNGIEIVDEFRDTIDKSLINEHLFLYRMLRKYLTAHPDITVVHNHSYNHSMEVMLAAKKKKIPVICEHSHAAYSDYWNPSQFSLNSRLMIAVSKIFTMTIPNYKIGCSRRACERPFGKSKNQYFIPNGVDFDKFSPEKYECKENLQKKYHLNAEDTNFIFVGRFSPQKNPLFMLEAFAALQKQKPNCHLTIVGYGEMEKEIKSTVVKLGLSERISFFPGDSNVPELLKASDYFITPSLYEGLGIVFVEAQLMGIPAFASDQVPEEADIGMCEFFPIKNGSKYYAQCIVEYVGKNDIRTIDHSKQKKYDMNEVTLAYEKIYSDNREAVEEYRIS